MKKHTMLKNLLAVAIMTILMLSCFAMSASAAKEMFREVGSVGVKNVVAPVPGQSPDYNAQVVNTGLYEIAEINWYRGQSPNNQYRVNASDRFDYDTYYTVQFTLQTENAYSFKTGSSGTTAVTGTVNGSTASVREVYGMDNKEYLNLVYTFPKTPKNVTIIDSITITGVQEPYAGDRAEYPVCSLPESVQPLVDGKGYYYDLAWYDGTRKMTNQEYFEEGKTYSCHIAMKAKTGYEFAADPNHLLGSAQYPFPTVSVTINGKAATVLPDNSVAPGSEVIIAAAQFTCKPSRKINHVDITVTEPKTDVLPNYSVTFGNATYKVKNFSNFAYKNGVAWMDKNGNYLTVNSEVFKPSSTYSIEVLLEANDPYVFSYTQQGAAFVTATVNGAEATVSASPDGERYLVVTYTFKKTSSLEVKKVEVSDIDEPKSGNFPDYTVTFGDTTYKNNSYYKDDEETKSGVFWYNDTTGEFLRAGVDKFQGGYTYSVNILISTAGNYTFAYLEETDEYTVTPKINGKNATIEEISETEVHIWYAFTLPEDKHVCTPTKVEEQKANCTENGKKAYYYCSGCGKYFENSYCTKQISDIASWGVILKTGHTGGTATCQKRATCKSCGQQYGDLKAHNFGSAWDYKDETGHAHKCKVCGTHDTIVPHSGDTAKCGEKAKCEVCRAEYGNVQNHQWSTQWDYTDAKGHAHKCTVAGCSEHSDIVKHTEGPTATETTPQTCTDCNFIIAPKLSHVHNLVKKQAEDETCTTSGMKSYYYCQSCDAIFSDSRGKNEITDKDSLVIPASGHKDSKWKTNTKVHWKECNNRGCDVITVEKEAHEFKQDGKCTVCGYIPKENGGSVQETDATDGQESTDEQEATGGQEPTNEQDATLPENTGEDTDPTTDATDGDDTAPVTTNNKLTKILVIVIGTIAIAGITVAVILMINKNKKQ